jgi:MFS family permease
VRSAGSGRPQAGAPGPAGAPVLRAQRSGHVVQTGSYLGHTSGPGLGLISASTLQAFAPAERAGATGAWAAGSAIAATLGPPLGGLLILLSWRWIFIVNPLPPTTTYSSSCTWCVWPYGKRWPGGMCW